MSEQIFMDHVSTTPCDERVLKEMLPYFSEIYGNPSSHIHSQGVQAAAGMDKAREQVADFIGAKSAKIVFTSGATEANNMAMFGLGRTNTKRKHILISELEHYSIFNTMHMLRSHGFEVELIPATKGGMITKEALLGKLRDDTLLVSVMHANGEIGVINPIKELAEIAHSKGALFHTDATASAGLLPIDFDDLNLDALTLSAHNFYGPKGVGALIVKDQVNLKSRIFGGWQEMGLRSGTENVPGIIGMGKAAELAKAELPALSKKLTALGDLLWKRLEEKIKFIHFTGQKSPRLPGHVSYWIEHVEGESVILMLNMNGIMCASGSACSSNLKGEDEDDLVASHVLEAVGVPTDICAGSVTFSLGKSNNEEQIEKTVEALVKVVDRLLMMSPSYADFLKNGETK